MDSAAGKKIDLTQEVQEIRIKFLEEKRADITSGLIRGADIYIDGQPTEFETPMEVMLRVGNRRIEVRREGYTSALPYIDVLVEGDDAVTIEAQSGLYGRITVHNQTGQDGIRTWGDQTATDPNTGGPLRGGALATMKRGGINSSVWIRTNGTADNNSWGVLTVENAAGNPAIMLNGQSRELNITGNLSKGSGSFKIDHPLDPANKCLSHSLDSHRCMWP